MGRICPSSDGILPSGRERYSISSIFLEQRFANQAARCRDVTSAVAQDGDFGGVCQRTWRIIHRPFSRERSK